MGNKSKFYVPEGGLCPITSEKDLIKDSTEYERSLGSVFLREFRVSKNHDFDRMEDLLRFYCRHSPMESLERIGFNFDRYAMVIELPHRGSAERVGADLVLRALATFIGDIR